MKLTGTNKPITYTTHTSTKVCSRSLCGSQPTNPPVCSAQGNKKQDTTTPCTPRSTGTVNVMYNKILLFITRTPNKPPTPHTSCWYWGMSYGGHSVGETPGPIPNPEAKTHSADGTAFERMWESRTPPDNTKNRSRPHTTRCGASLHLTTKPPPAQAPFLAAVLAGRVALVEFLESRHGTRCRRRCSSWPW